MSHLAGCPSGSTTSKVADRGTKAQRDPQLESTPRVTAGHGTAFKSPPHFTPWSLTRPSPAPSTRRLATRG